MGNQSNHYGSRICKLVKTPFDVDSTLLKNLDVEFVNVQRKMEVVESTKLYSHVFDLKVNQKGLIKVKRSFNQHKGKG